jgi:rhodanese-related sulfurtransferase
MAKILQFLLVLGFLVFAIPQAFSQDQNEPICTSCELSAKGGAKCPSHEKAKCKLSGKDSGCSEKAKCNLTGKDSGCSKKGKCKLYKKLKHGPYINTTVLENLLESNLPMVLLDARSGKYDDKTRIPGAQSLNDKSTKDEVAKVIKTKDTLVITYCANLKCPASKNLYIHLKKLGYKNVLEYPFGMECWLGSGNDIEMAE